MKENTYSYSDGGPADSGDITQFQKGLYTSIPDPLKKKKLSFRRYLKMMEKKEKEDNKIKEDRPMPTSGKEIISKCVECGKEYDRKPVKNIKTGGISSGFCELCLKILRKKKGK